MPGGVGGQEPRGPPYPDQYAGSAANMTPTVTWTPSFFNDQKGG
jgi:hypothetical protein